MIKTAVFSSPSCSDVCSDLHYESGPHHGQPVWPSNPPGKAVFKPHLKVIQLQLFAKVLLKVTAPGMLEDSDSC
jgi:hypothetical protein